MTHFTQRAPSVDDIPCSRSRFLRDHLSAHGERMARIHKAGWLSADTSLDLEAEPLGLGDNVDRYAALRAFRNRALAVIAWRDLAGIDPLDATLGALTDLADRCIEAALRHAEARVAERYGMLRDANGEPIRLIVIGMGKLGGGELNFSSDIDLIFSHAGRVHSDGERELDADAYCRRVAQKMVQTLAVTTADGFVYRVDTRLRPFGDVGALVASVAAMEQYYQAHGREWERYAWVKARPVAGDLEGGQRLIDRLRPFVYRRYLDYGTLESIREMKAMIERQVARGEWHANIKLGAGGIREVEFIVQAFQLIRGGQEPELQDNRLRPTLERLIAAGHLPSATGHALDEAYVYLRRVENRLQMVDDRQTHDMPEHDEARSVIANAMGYECLATFDAELAAVRQVVQDAFAEVFASPQAEGKVRERDDELLTALWDGQYEAADAGNVLADYNIADADAVVAALEELRNQRLYRVLGERGRSWIARLVPLMIAASSRNKQPDRALLRTLPVISAIIGRSNYIALLVEHPAALETLIRLCDASEWIASRIAEQPALLDSLLDPRLLSQQPRRHELIARLEDDLSAIDRHDLGQRMDTLRRFNGGATCGGRRELNNQVFFTRLTQRLTHILSIQTPAGRVYEIDMRLRPSGNTGLMVTHIDAFALYQRGRA